MMRQMPWDASIHWHLAGQGALENKDMEIIYGIDFFFFNKQKRHRAQYSPTRGGAKSQYNK